MISGSAQHAENAGVFEEEEETEEDEQEEIVRGGEKCRPCTTLSFFAFLPFVCPTLARPTRFLDMERDRKREPDARHLLHAVIASRSPRGMRPRSRAAPEGNHTLSSALAAETRCAGSSCSARDSRRKPSSESAVVSN